MLTTHAATWVLWTQQAQGRTSLRAATVGRDERPDQRLPPLELAAPFAAMQSYDTRYGVLVVATSSDQPSANTMLAWVQAGWAHRHRSALTHCGGWARLPTAAEWVWVARDGGVTPWVGVPRSALSITPGEIPDIAWGQPNAFGVGSLHISEVADALGGSRSLCVR